MPVTVSVIIASHRPAEIRKCLDALRPQIGSEAEVIVAADYDNRELIDEYAWVRWVRCNASSIPAQRNAGARAARGETLAFIDDDCRPCAGWLAHGLDFLNRHGSVDAVEGRTLVPAPASDLGGLYREFKRLETPGFRTSNIFYRKHVFNEAGGFDERFTAQREDADLAFTVMERGGEIGYNAAMCVEHPVRFGERWDLLKNCWNRRFDPLLYRKHAQYYRQHIGSPFTGAIAAAGGAHVVAVAAALAGGWQTGMIAAAVDAAVIAALTLRRNRRVWAHPRAFAAQWIAWLAAPVVLIAALTWGSIRFRTLLII